ncbi:spectrin beta chain, non-erythrocytic 5-like isoform X2 [Hyla sarda]|uniref:spectrin beta chain, non-erythrocytic 5-like isoform X2 n=1 Tax=Hyla sarda TaxID=327740 RepID=UPI0024C234A6|nr:spectrin beta chain, non-erythrocytic 5-like isoform X2 [Hyla sarda]
MRKPQPFTIGTRLSIPKCPDLSTSSPGADGALKPPHIHDPLCGHLVQDSPPSPPRGAAHPPDSYITDGDHFCPGSLVRSIKKIALSRPAEGAVLRAWPAAKTVHGNCNNNNSRGLSHVTPGAADLPQSVRDPRLIIGVAECHRTAKGPGPPCDSLRTSPPDIIQLSREIKQVENWVQCKLQEVTEEGDTSTLQRDLQTYEGSVLQLSQMVDQVSRAQPPGMASVRSQLHTLRDQWQLLKKMAVNQNCALGGATALLEFNKKADELEMWMREKEDIPPLHLLLDENLDKVQITRKILDLKQEQIRYCSLQENINNLAQKLEKLGRPESRAAATRRKHLNRMWLRLQTSLHEHHQTLQWALEAASLWHQSDTILRTLEEKSRSAVALSRDGGHTDQDLRDIGRQIMMLDVTISQVSRLHPLLSSRALHKYQQMKERWARLQHTLRTAPSRREEGDPVTPQQSSVGNQEQSLLGCVVPVCQIEKTNIGKSTALSALSPQRQTEVRGRHQSQTTRSATSEPGANHSPQKGHQPPRPPQTPEVRHLLQELGSACQWLQGVERLLSEPAAMRSPELIRKDLKHVSLLEREVRARGAALHGLRGNVRKLKTAVTEEVKEKVQEVEERFQTLQDAFPRRVSDLRDTLVLSEFMKVVQMEEERKKKETMTAPDAVRGDPNAPSTHRTETFTPLEELQEAVEMLNEAAAERERALSATRETAELEGKVSTLGHMMAAARAKLQDVRSCAEAAEKEFVTVKKETELRDLRGTFTLQEEVESDISAVIGPEVRRLQDLHPFRSVGGLEAALRTWTDLQELVSENQAQIQRTERLREFFLRYLKMISWTEVTRGQIVSESPRSRFSSAQREELERRMEGRLKEFEALAGIGWRLIGEDHTLARMIQERLEEVQGLLSWLLMRWKDQKHKRIMGNQTPKMKTSEDDDNMKELKIALGSAALEFECPDDEDVIPPPAPRGPTLRKYRRRALSPILFQPLPCRPTVGIDVEEGRHQDGPRKCAKGPLWLEPKNLPRESVSPEPQEEAMMVTRRLDFHLMEGSLEKKHVLQVGGRKASNRTWGTFYAVLVRRTLCFYYDHKHSTKRSASSPPLHLTGAVCTLESDYTKRDNCFRLRLMDGSEYLFRAPTPESLQQWVKRLRHNSGMEDADLLRGAAVASDRSPRIRSLMPDLCQSEPTRADPSWKEGETMTAGIPKNNSHHLLLEGADPESNGTTRRRSQSFSSVVYQKVPSVSGPQDSSFSVTLYIDDPLIPRIRCHSFAAPQGALLSRHTAHLRPQNKSVFRKFFRKKE